MDSLRSAGLFPARDAGADGHDGAGGGSPDAAPDLPGTDLPVDLAVDLGSGGDAPSDLPADVAEAGTDALLDVAADAPADLSAPTGMLSGTVRDSCGSSGIDALVGIGGRHTCSYRAKGSYFFPRLPLGTLKLGATKEGYALYEATVEIVAGGTIHDIQLVPADAAGGCATLPAPAVACTCTASTCEP